MTASRRFRKLDVILAGVVAIALLASQYLAFRGPFWDPAERLPRSAQITDPEIAGYVRILEGPGNEDTKLEVFRKLQALGDRAAPAIPYLLDLEVNRWRGYDTGFLLLEAIKMLPSLRGKEVMNVLIHELDRDDSGRYAAADLLMYYGKKASAAVPKLMDENGIKPFAAVPLAAIDPDLPRLPARLTELAVSPRLSNWQRLEAVEALGWLGPRSKIAVGALSSLLNPALTQGALLASDQLNDAEIWQGAVISTLGQIGPDARAAASRLKPFLTNSSVPLRIAAARSLWQITADPQPLVPVLIRILDKERLDRSALCSRFNIGQTNSAPVDIASATQSLLDEIAPGAVRQEDIAPLRRLRKETEAAVR